tara:strand:+ start:1763 stop:2419 length:657 start_codon:yes stop_codon:yes gene_type:complete
MNLKINIFLLSLFSFLLSNDLGQFTITRINYSGGGDWYADPSSIPNLLRFAKNNTSIDINLKENRAKIGSDNFNSSSYLYLTGHGNIRFKDDEIVRLREHLMNGAFLHADDNYGMDESFRREMKKIFPEKEWIEISPSHNLFNIYYKFPNGLPKVHEHDNKRPQALGLFHQDKLIVLYTYESDLGDGWEDPNVHNTSREIRNSALKMGVNIILTSILQ